MNTFKPQAPAFSERFLADLLPGLQSMRFKAVALFLLACPLPVLAGPWVICDYLVQIEATSPSGVRATVKEAGRKNPGLCLQAGAGLSFTPESENYQSPLPRKRWPTPGQAVPLRYRELSGICKHDGASTPCTIRHYSILGRR